MLIILQHIPYLQIAYKTKETDYYFAVVSSFFSRAVYAQGLSILVSVKLHEVFFLLKGI